MDGRGIGSSVPSQETGITSYPLRHGNGKPGFGADANRVRQRTARTRSQQLFPPTSADGDQRRSQRAQELGVDQRRANFQRVRHAGPIGVAQQLVAQIEPRLQRCDSVGGGAGVRSQELAYIMEG